MHLLFTEIEPSDQKAFQKAFASHTVFFTHETINNLNLGKYKNIEILSIFIHSKIDKSILQQLPSLKLIVTRSTGTDHIDIQATNEQLIEVRNIPTYASQAVAEYTFGLLLCLARKIHLAYCRVQVEHILSHHSLEGFELNDKTIGIIGLGNIGKIVGRIATGFGMNLLACDQKEDTEYASSIGCSYTTFQAILAKSDILTLHVPLTKHTYHLINQASIQSMKPGAYLINTARGAIIETNSLLQALNTGHIAGAALDVLEDEKDLSPENKALIKHPKVIVSPHNAFNTQEARKRLIEETISTIQKWIQS